VHGSNIVFFGPSSSGKTVMMNAILHLYPSGNKLITHEEVKECRFRPDQWVVDIPVPPPEAEREGVDTKSREIIMDQQRSPSAIMPGEIQTPEHDSALIDTTKKGYQAFATKHMETGLIIEGFVYDSGDARTSIDAKAVSNLDMFVHIRREPLGGGRTIRRVLGVYDIVQDEDGSYKERAICKKNILSGGYDYFPDSKGLGFEDLVETRAVKKSMGGSKIVLDSKYMGREDAAVHAFYKELDVYSSAFDEMVAGGVFHHEKVFPVYMRLEALFKPMSGFQLTRIQGEQVIQDFDEIKRNILDYIVDISG